MSLCHGTEVETTGLDSGVSETACSANEVWEFATIRFGSGPSVRLLHLDELPGEAGGDEKASEREEARAQAELKRITPSNAELLRLAKRSPAPQDWYDE